MNIYLYILAMALTTYLIRVLPMTIFLRFALTSGGIFVIMRREEGVVGAQRGTESTYW